MTLATTRTLLYQKALAQQLPRALLAAVGGPGARRFAAAAASAPTSQEWPSHNGAITTSILRKNNNYGKYAAAIAGVATAQYFLGDQEEFFDYRFTTDKKPEDLADFYGTEAFMDIFCVFPFMAKFMLRSGTFDEKGHVHTYGLGGPGNLEVSIDFEEVEEDTCGDGLPDTIAWFNKRETFEDKSPLLGGMTLWHMTQNFGYHRLHSGQCEVYHNGEQFKGIFPIRLLFQAHAAYTFWATKRFVNGDEFGTEDLEDEAEIIRQNIPFSALKDFTNRLTSDLETLKKTSHDESSGQYDDTISKLKTISNDERKSNVAHFTKMRRRNSSLVHMKLTVEDEETQQAIGKALNHISEAKGEKDAALVAVSNLQKHITRVHEMDNDE
eukprot:CAMPEP_0197717312 /NCGR_PEP_ID=MMETSP1434-20131217/1896_1 /TAXON_ID=265543 /ORGANISM="Minutocellus polymorphus, Strain CCMP3303" /LENGTH=381 /DNA_ID=CAMNT_0043301827 /DNA_START=80 /DNA_END=1225 /DNA_ORIENTATION=+